MKPHHHRRHDGFRDRILQFGKLGGAPNTYCTGNEIRFAALVERLGFVPGTFLLGFIASFADKKNSIKNALAIAVFLTFLCVAVFIWFLNVPFPLFGAL